MASQPKYLCLPFSGITNANDAAPGRTLADQLSKVLNEYHAKGWEFQRIDTIRIYKRAGCLTSLFGGGDSVQDYHILIFKQG